MTQDEQARSFGAGAAVYEVGRPEYQAEAVAWLLEPVLGGDRPLVADIGAGTGKLTRAVLAAGAEAVAVDPDPRMLAALREAVPGVETLDGTAERLPLPDASMDAAVAGQAWHWVEPAAASREVGRVVRPGGVLGLIWNSRDSDAPLVRRLMTVLPPSPAEEYVTGQGPDVRAPFASPEGREWRWTRTMDRPALVAMMRSRSFYLTASAAERATADDALGALLDDLDVLGEATIEVPYVTRAFRAARPAGA